MAIVMIRKHRNARNLELLLLLAALVACKPPPPLCCCCCCCCCCCKVILGLPLPHLLGNTFSDRWATILTVTVQKCRA